MNKLASKVRSGKSPQRSGLTLIELMIAVTLTLVIIAVMVRAFKLTSDEIGVGRARMDMHNQLRTVTETLRRDFQMATCLPRPRGLNDERTGYFEYVEGGEYDRDHLAVNFDSFLGDHDDVLALTIRSDEKPFRGRYNGGFVESNLAEVVWFVVHTGADDYSGQFRLYRRVLLIRPDLDLSALPPAAADFFEANDISARPEAGVMIANSLDELANRRNRYAHSFAAFPHELQNGFGAQANWLSERVLGIDGGDGVFDPDREGEDQMLNNCVGFDIKVFDPKMEAFIPNAAEFPGPSNPSIGQVVDFNDAGFNNPNPAYLDDAIDTYPPATYPLSYPQVGGYVDLAYDSGTPPPLLFSATNRWFASNPTARPPGYSYSAATWCSWWAGYESDGIDQDGDGLFDEGANGVDDDLANGIDDNGERETPPPYAHPIRSIQISVRMIEKKTNQVLQKTIKESFVPN